MSGAHAAIHAAQEKKKKQSEEEEMTQYNERELAEDYEFKILRSATNAFKKRENVEQAIDEESIAGWVLVEKFDNERLRFKRPASARRKDAMLPPGIDPYRTNYGVGEAGLAFIIMGIVAVVGGLIAFLVFLFA
ncbi:MAG TPA: hypothetical protein VJ965_08670 [Anaerolineales bacterium]|nr:hypothetical protein [Anaerolineales bacterium]